MAATEPIGKAGPKSDDGLLARAIEGAQQPAAVGVGIAACLDGIEFSFGACGGTSGSWDMPAARSS